nr:MFS transporter [Haloplanus sp. XH21]
MYAWALGYAAVGAASLLVPLYAIALGADPFVVGLVEATAGLAGVPGALIWGRLADETGGRRGFVLGSLFGAGAVLIGFPLLSAPVAVVLLNGVLWFVVSAASPVVTLFMIEGAPESEWETRIGLLNAFQRYGWVGGLLVGVGWLGAVATGLDLPAIAAQRGLFYLCAAATVAATPLAFYWLPPRTTTTPGRLARSGALGRLVAGGRYVKLVAFVPLRSLFTRRIRRPTRLLTRFSPGLRRYFVVVFLFSAAFSVFFGPAPAYLADLRYDSTAIFGFFIVSNFVSAVVFVPIGRLTARLAPATLQLRALAVRTALFPALGLVGILSAWWLRTGSITLGFALIGLTWAVVAVTAAGLVSRAAPTHLRGEALGIYTALSGIGAGLGGAVGGAIANAAGYTVAFGVAGLLVGVSALVLLTMTPALPTGVDTGG